MTVRIELRIEPTGEVIVLDDPRLVVAGYTGRDSAAVEHHIEELAAIGVPRPATVPAFFELDPELLTTADRIGAGSNLTSGEAEPVLVLHAGRRFLGVGSDHTDRDVERTDIGASKAACPKPIARSVVELPAAIDLDAWDATGLASTADGAPYQRGTLVGVRTLDDILAVWTEVTTDRDPDRDLVMFGGTVPLLDGVFVDADEFTCSLELPDGGVLRHTYRIERTPDALER